MDTQDYAQMQLALALLGESFVNRYPESGAMQTVQGAKDVAQTTIASEEAKKQQKKAEKQAKKEGIGGTLGAAVPIALAPFTGGASLAFSGLGAQAGSALAGGTLDPGAVANSIDPAMFAGMGGGVSKQQAATTGQQLMAAPTQWAPDPITGAPSAVPLGGSGNSYDQWLRQQQPPQPSVYNYASTLGY